MQTYLEIKIELSNNDSNSSISELEQTNNLTLLELIQLLNNIDGIDSIVQFFIRYTYTVNKHIPGVVGIKYIDGVNRI
jgi:hypothetical protein